MPHKRAKKSVRDKNTQDSGFNNAPSGYRIDREQLPKGAMRILMGGQIQAEYREKNKNKRKRAAEGADDREKADLQIRPDERLNDYNRRIDNKMRKEINSTIKSNTSEKAAKQMNKKLEDREASKKESATKAKEREEEMKAQEEAEEEDSDGETMKAPRDFAAAERVRLNDVAQAPPSLPRMNRQARRYGVEDSNAGNRVGAPLMRQMELERERQRVISLYRAQKGKRLENWVSSREADGA